MQLAAIALVELDEIIGLHDGIVEFQEGQRLVAVQPQLDAVHGQHAVDRKVPADIAQEGNVIQLVQPLGIVHQDGVVGAVAEFQQMADTAQDALLVGLDLLRRQDQPRFVLAGGIAGLGGAAAHQQDGAVSGLL